MITNHPVHDTPPGNKVKKINLKNKTLGDESPKPPLFFYTFQNNSKNRTLMDIFMERDTRFLKVDPWFHVFLPL